MLLEAVENSFTSMDVEGVSADKLLGDDLAMDSQELLCAALNLEKAFSTEIKAGELRRDMSVLEVTKLISRKLAPTITSELFDHTLSEDALIEASVDEVYKGLYQVEFWPEKLPHVRRIDKAYDDGLFQKFEMEVEGSNGSIISVHSIRYCERNRIRFFQPVPPTFMQYHCGEWILQPFSGNITHLLTRHYWHLSASAVEAFPGLDGISTSERVQRWLSEHARFALECWKSSFQRG